MYQPLIKFHPYPAIITQVLRIFVPSYQSKMKKCKELCTATKSLPTTELSTLCILITS